jgi:hypothetical protein
VRSALIVIAVLSLVLASCAKIPSPQEANDAVLALRQYEAWAWAVGIALIWVDLLLPVPQTAVIAALGMNLRRHPDHKLPAVSTGGNWFRHVCLKSVSRMIRSRPEFRRW